MRIDSIDYSKFWIDKYTFIRSDYIAKRLGITHNNLMSQYKKINKYYIHKKIVPEPRLASGKKTIYGIQPYHLNKLVFRKNNETKQLIIKNIIKEFNEAYNILDEVIDNKMKKIFDSFK